MYTSARHGALQRLLQELGFRRYKPLQDSTPQGGLSGDHFGRVDCRDLDATPYSDWRDCTPPRQSTTKQQVSLAFKAGSEPKGSACKGI